MEGIAAFEHEEAWDPGAYSWDPYRLQAQRNVAADNQGAWSDDDGTNASGGNPPGVSPLLWREHQQAKTSKLPKGPLICQVEGCGKDLAQEKGYYQRYRVCEQHLKLLSLMVDGKPSRFCQQCGRFHELSNFDGNKRSCRARLLQHNARRRKRTPSSKAPLTESSRGKKGFNSAQTRSESSGEGSMDQHGVGGASDKVMMEQGPSVVPGVMDGAEVSSGMYDMLPAANFNVMSSLTGQIGTFAGQRLNDQQFGMNMALEPSMLLHSMEPQVRRSETTSGQPTLLQPNEPQYNLGGSSIPQPFGAISPMANPAAPGLQAHALWPEGLQGAGTRPINHAGPAPAPVQQNAWAGAGTCTFGGGSSHSMSGLASSSNSFAGCGATQGAALGGVGSSLGALGGSLMNVDGGYGGLRTPGELIYNEPTLQLPANTHGMTSFEMARMLMARGGPSSAVQYKSEDVMVRVSMKIANCTPDQLPPDLYLKLKAKLAECDATMIQGFLRPGCTHVLLDVAMHGQGRSAAELDADAIARTLGDDILSQHTVLVQRDDLVTCFPAGEEGSKRVEGSRRMEGSRACPTLLYVEPVAVVTDCETSFYAVGRHLGRQGPSALLRTQGGYLPVSCERVNLGTAAARTLLAAAAACNPAELGVNHAAGDVCVLRVTARGAPSSGLAVLELQGANDVVLGNWRPVLLLEDAEQARDVRLLEACCCATPSSSARCTLEQLLLDLGRVLDFCNSARHYADLSHHTAGPQARDSYLQQHAVDAKLCSCMARQLLVACTAAGLNALARSMGEALETLAAHQVAAAAEPLVTASCLQPQAARGRLQVDATALSATLPCFLLALVMLLCSACKWAASCTQECSRGLVKLQQRQASLPAGPRGTSLL